MCFWSQVSVCTSSPGQSHSKLVFLSLCVRYLLSPIYVLERVIGTWHMSMNKTDFVPCPCSQEAYTPVGVDGQWANNHTNNDNYNDATMKKYRPAYLRPSLILFLPYLISPPTFSSSPFSSHCMPKFLSFKACSNAIFFMNIRQDRERRLYHVGMQMYFYAHLLALLHARPHILYLNSAKGSQHKPRKERTQSLLME